MKFKDKIMISRVTKMMIMMVRISHKILTLMEATVMIEVVVMKKKLIDLLASDKMVVMHQLDRGV